MQKLTDNALTWGVIGTSNKADERRVPIHPAHLSRIPEGVRRQLIFEQGYGAPFNISDATLGAQTGGVAPRQQLLADIGRVIVTKPVLADLAVLRKGGTLWGYVHCVQQRDITQAAIERQQTLIALEDMFAWGPNGQQGLHSFYKNNEMAGYCAVIHALQLKGINGHYGNPRKTVIFGFGAVSRGAIYALQAQGFSDITICVQRPLAAVRQEILGCTYVHLRPGNTDEARLMVVNQEGKARTLTELISETDIIVNGTFQNTDHPIDFVSKAESQYLKANSLIIDVSCDEGMGFYFAKPTTFENPLFQHGSTDYYAVDHTPTYFWDSASRAISEALIEYLPAVVIGRHGWQKNETLRRAINIETGVIKNTAILSFQQRSAQYPHHPLNSLGKTGAKVRVPSMNGHRLGVAHHVHSPNGHTARANAKA